MRQLVFVSTPAVAGAKHLADLKEFADFNSAFQTLERAVKPGNALPPKLSRIELKIQKLEFSVQRLQDTHFAWEDKINEDEPTFNARDYDVGWLKDQADKATDLLDDTDDIWSAKAEADKPPAPPGLRNAQKQTGPT